VVEDKRDARQSRLSRVSMIHHVRHHTRSVRDFPEVRSPSSSTPTSTHDEHRLAPAFLARRSHLYALDFRLTLFFRFPFFAFRSRRAIVLDPTAPPCHAFVRARRSAWSPCRYNKAIQIASRALRASLKEESRVAAEKRGVTLVRYQKWENGSGGEQVRHTPLTWTCQLC
jgi:F-type H+-transporting ATPase subunit epsilon